MYILQTIFRWPHLRYMQLAISDTSINKSVQKKILQKSYSDVLLSQWKRNLWRFKQALSRENPFSGSRDINHWNFNPVIPAYLCVESGASTIFWKFVRIARHRAAPLLRVQMSAFTRIGKCCLGHFWGADSESVIIFNPKSFVSSIMAVVWWF